MPEIKLTQGKIAIVDEEDFEWLNQWKWYVSKDDKTLYAVRHEKIKMIQMHRLIMAAPLGVEIDHKNGDGLDNRRDNPRLATHAQNQRNRSRQRNNKSGYKGVSWSKYARKWRSQIQINGKVKHLGYFICKDSAARVYNNAATEYFGEFAELNVL